jgi:transposase
MAKPRIVKVKETVKELQVLSQKQNTQTGVQKVQLILTLRAHSEGISKESLASIVGISHNTANTWRNLYASGGTELLLRENRKGTKEAAIDAVTLKKIHARLSSNKDYFISYKELQQWVNEQCGKSIQYQALYNYIGRKLPAKLKVPRKSHVQKDEAAVAVFKKTTRGHRTH